MQDPYSVLGISRNATDDEIKKAYRNKSRKYHPDANINNPNKAQAEAKFKEVQQAYQQIMKEKEYGQGSGGSGYGEYGSFGGFGGFGGAYGNAYGGQNQESESDVHMKAAANYIRSGHYKEALHVLEGIAERNALWYYYSAIANSGVGNNVLALQHAQEAVRREPNNPQYQMLLRQFESGGSWYESMRSPYGQTSMQGGSCCMKLCIANLVCNLCCGGGGMCYGGRPI